MITLHAEDGSIEGKTIKWNTLYLTLDSCFIMKAHSCKRADECRLKPKKP